MLGNSLSLPFQNRKAQRIIAEIIYCNKTYILHIWNKTLNSGDIPKIFVISAATHQASIMKANKIMRLIKTRLQCKLFWKESFYRRETRRDISSRILRAEFAINQLAIARTRSHFFGNTSNDSNPSFRVLLRCYGTAFLFLIRRSEFIN